MKYYLIGEDKSFEEIKDIPIATLKIGENGSGSIVFQSPSQLIDIIRFITGNSAGSGICIGGGGFTCIGSGESSTMFQPQYGQGDAERMIVAGDTTIEFYVNCNNTPVKVEMGIDGLLSGHQKKISSGTSAPSGGANGDIYIQY